MDGINAPPISPRFEAASRQSVSPTVSAERAGEITARRDNVAARAQSHFEANRQSWTTRQYGELLAVEGPRLELKPKGAVDDRKAHLMRAADSMVLHRQSKRLAQIERAAIKMLGKNHDGLER